MYIKIFIGALVFFVYTISVAEEPFTTAYESIVDDVGNITMPKNYRSDWTFLGTWSIAEGDVEDSRHGAAGLHNVYTQPGVAEYFQQNGDFPDGAVIVKELLKAVTASMTTGTVSRGSGLEGWFVMVKDTKGRFSSNPLWGDGWGWAFFNKDQTDKTTTKSYKTECIACHIPARDDDWVYLSGYPLLVD